MKLYNNINLKPLACIAVVVLLSFQTEKSSGERIRTSSGERSRTSSGERSRTSSGERSRTSSGERSRTTDSLKNLLQTNIADTTRVKTLNALAWKYKSTNPDTSIILSNQALELAVKNEDKKGQAKAFRYLGVFNYLKGNYPNALENFHKALKINKALNDQKGISATIGNIGSVYYRQGDYHKALEYYFKALKIAEELGNKNGIAKHLGNIGSVYNSQGDYPNALEYYFKALKMSEELGNKNHISAWLGNIGIVYMEQGDYPNALEYYFKALKMDEELGRKRGIAIKLGNIGNVYYEQGDYPKALEYFFKALKIAEEIGTKSGIAINLGNIGSLYTSTKKYAEAEKYLLRALEIAEEIGYLVMIKDANSNLSNLYAETNRYQLAYEHDKAYNIAKDSLFNEEKSKDIGRLEQNHEFDIAELKRVQVEEEAKRRESEARSRQNLLQYSGIVIGLLVIGLLVGVMGRFRVRPGVVEGVLFMGILILFEFLLVLLDPFIEQLTGGEPLWKLLCNGALAGGIFPFHSLLIAKLKKQVIRTERENATKTPKHKIPQNYFKRKWSRILNQDLPEPQDGYRQKTKDKKQKTKDKSQKTKDKDKKGKSGNSGTIKILIFVSLVIVHTILSSSKIDSLTSEKSEIRNPKSEKSPPLDKKDLTGQANQKISNQQIKIDSLKTELQKGLADTTRVNTLNTLAWELKYTNPDTSIILSNQALELAVKNEDKKGQANAFLYLGAFNYLKGNYPNALENYHKALKINKALNNQKGISATIGNIGLVYWNQGDYPNALEYFFKALKMDEELGNKNGIARHLGNIGVVYNDQGDYPNALEYYFKALKMSEELGNKNHIAAILGNIGTVYNEQGDYPNALEYFFKALKMDEELGNKNGIARHLGNIGNVYYSQGDYPNALEYYFKALKIAEEIGTKSGIAIKLGNIGSVYKDQGDYPNALEYYFKALKMDEELGNKRGIAIKLGNIGSLYTSTKKYAEAEKYLLQALEMCREIGALNEEREFEESISELYAQTHRYQLAYEHHKASGIAKDSLFNEEKSKDIGKLEAKHEFEMAEQERKRIEEEQARIETGQKSRRDNLQYSGILIFLVALLIAISFSGRLALPIKLAEGVVFFTFLLFFEFILMYLDPYIEQLTGGEPAYKLAINAGIAAIIFPLHQFFETKLKQRIFKAKRRKTENRKRKKEIVNKLVTVHRENIIR